MDQSDSQEVSRLWRVYRTVHEMVSDRGYLVSKAELELPFEEFSETYSTAGIIEYT